jgi:hypothetical protein
MLHLVTTWYMVVRRAHGPRAEVESFRRVFVQPDAGDRPATAAMDALRRYLRRLGLDERLVPIFALHHRLELAVRRADQRADQGLRGQHPRDDNPWVSAVTLLGLHAERLFSTRR